MTTLLTSTSSKVWRSCQREYEFRYLRGYRPAVDATALQFGTTIHKGLEVMWRAWQARRKDPLAEALGALDARVMDGFEHAKAQVLLTGYFLRWKDEPLTILDVEAQFETPLTSPTMGRHSGFMLAGKIDAIVEDKRDGLIKLVEHKTSSESVEPGALYWKKLRLNAQVSAYFEGAKSLGLDASGMIYDVIKKPGQKPLQVNSRRSSPETAEAYRERVAEEVQGSLDEYFRRGTVVRLESELNAALEDLYDTADEILRAEKLTRYPRNAGSCVRYGRECPYFSVCCGEASLDDESLFVRSDSIHPELSGPAKEEQQHAVNSSDTTT